jgi:AraC-like DNA-binding protein
MDTKTDEAFGAKLARRYEKSAAPSAILGSMTSRQMAITRLTSRTGLSAPTSPIPPEPALVYIYRLLPATNYRLWVDGKELATEPIPLGGVNIADLESSPVCWPQAAFDSLQFYVPRQTLDQFADETRAPRVGGFDCAKVVYDPMFASLANLALPSLSSQAPLPSLFMDYFVLLFCAHVVGKSADGFRHSGISGGLSALQQKRAIDLLSCHLEGDITLRRVANECGLSVSHFARSFKASFGLPVHRWLVRQRIEKAKTLLRRKDRSLIDIAFSAGFSDQAAFTRGFTKAVGISPGRWRRLNLSDHDSSISSQKMSMAAM